MALGGTLSAGTDGYSHRDYDLDEVNIGAGVLLTYHATLGDQTFLRPQFGFGVSYAERSVHFADEAAFEAVAYESNGLRLRALESDLGLTYATAFLPLAYTPAPGVFLGLGPFVRGRWAFSGILDPFGRESAFTIGIASIIGTWL